MNIASTDSKAAQVLCAAHLHLGIKKMTRVDSRNRIRYNDAIHKATVHHVGWLIKDEMSMVSLEYVLVKQRSAWVE